MTRILPIVLLICAPLAQAQETPVGLQSDVAAAESTSRLLTISGGQVYLDGELLPDAAPEDLDLRGIEIDFTYDGRFMEPVIMVDGVNYVLEDDKLVPLEDSEREGETVFPVPEQPPIEAVARANAPRTQNAYMQVLSEEDRSLYEKIQRERQIEAGILELKREYDAMEPGEMKDDLAERLREEVAQAFDLRQEIHREELERARRQVEDLDDALIRRADVRDEIIDARMEELIGSEE